MRHWEVTGLATAGALAAWTSAGGTAWAVVALVAAGATAGLGVWPRPEPERGRARWWPMLLAVTGVLGALGALVAARRIRALENNWPAGRGGVGEDGPDPVGGGP